MLRNYGVDIPIQKVIRDDVDITAAIIEFGNTPLAMKVVSKDILHKSDAGGVQLNLIGETALRQGREEILKSCLRYDVNADIEGVLITPMAKKGIEIIIGVSHDPIFGAGANVRIGRYFRRNP